MSYGHWNIYDQNKPKNPPSVIAAHNSSVYLNIPKGSFKVIRIVYIPNLLIVMKAFCLWSRYKLGSKLSETPFLIPSNMLTSRRTMPAPAFKGHVENCVRHPVIYSALALWLANCSLPGLSSCPFSCLA